MLHKNTSPINALNDLSLKEQRLTYCDILSIL